MWLQIPVVFIDLVPVLLIVTLHHYNFKEKIATKRESQKMVFDEEFNLNTSGTEGYIETTNPNYDSTTKIDLEQFIDQ